MSIPNFKPDGLTPPQALTELSRLSMCRGLALQAFIGGAAVGKVLAAARDQVNEDPAYLDAALEEGIALGFVCRMMGLMLYTAEAYHPGSEDKAKLLTFLRAEVTDLQRITGYVEADLAGPLALEAEIKALGGIDPNRVALLDDGVSLDGVPGEFGSLDGGVEVSCSGSDPV